MSRARLMRWMAVYGLAMALLCLAIAHTFRLRRDGRGTGQLVVSDWREGSRIARFLVRRDDGVPPESESREPDVLRTVDEIVDERPVLGRTDLLFRASFAPATDGVKVVFRDKVALLTPDDLLVQGAYPAQGQGRRGKLGEGVDRDKVLESLADELHVAQSALLAEGTFRRVALRRIAPTPKPPLDLTKDNLDRAIAAAANYLANQLKPNGSFRYEVDPLTNRESSGYSWPRHAGATWFLAEVAQHTGDARLTESALRAAKHMLDAASQRCQGRRCIGERPRVNVGSSALGLIALVQLVEAGQAPHLLPIAGDLADFLCSQQRQDGEFMHTFDLESGRPIDEQKAYFTGEAALALARIHRLTRNPRHLEAARRALAFLVWRPLWASGTRYIWAPEHWTCQAAEELWERAPDARALEFCLQWQQFLRASASEDPATAGAVATTPYAAIHYTPSASSTEAAVATLHAAAMAGLDPQQIAELEAGLRQTLRLLLNAQFLPGPVHLMRDPQAAYGAFPSGNVEYAVRIDFPQHAGMAMLRYRRWLGP